MFDKKKAAADLQSVLMAELAPLLGEDLVAVDVFVTAKSAARIVVFAEKPDGSRQVVIEVHLRDRTSKEGAAGRIVRNILEDRAEAGSHTGR